MATSNLRPTYSRLPVRGYQDNSLADALTQHYDAKLVSVGKQIEELHTKLDPVTTPAVYLDWLAFMVGMVDPYYSRGWQTAVKRLAIKAANKIFENRGTLLGLQLALNVHSIQYDVYSSDDLRLPFTFTPSTRFGLVSSRVFVRLPLIYPKTGYEYKEAQRAVRNYTALVTPTAVSYDKFYLGFSAFADPIF